MSQQSVGQGPGNLVPDTEFKLYKCSAAVTKGWAVSVSGATAVAALVAAGDADAKDGLCVEGSDTDAADTTGVIGYAMEDGAANAWIKVAVRGFVGYIITDESVDEGDHLIPTAAPGIVGGTAGGTRDLLGLGVALAADATALLSKAYIR